MKATTYTYPWIFYLSLVNHNLRMVCTCLRVYKVKLIFTNQRLSCLKPRLVILYPPIFLEGPNFDALSFVIFSPPVLKIEHVQWWIHHLFFILFKSSFPLVSNRLNSRGKSFKWFLLFVQSLVRANCLKIEPLQICHGHWMWIGKLRLIYSFTFCLTSRKMIWEWGSNYWQKTRN